MSQISSNPIQKARTHPKLVSTPSKVPEVVSNQIQPPPKCADLILINSNSLQSVQMWHKSDVTTPECSKLSQTNYNLLKSARTCPTLILPRGQMCLGGTPLGKS